MKNVLLIDGTGRVLPCLDDGLAQAGYAVLPAGTVAEGLTVCAARRVDLIMLDLALPEAADLSFLEELRRHSGQRKIPVILLSSGGNLPSLSRLAEIGVVACFANSPFGLHRLLQFIQESAGLDQAAAEAA